jgi:DNA-binding XRE family transcriptional regulator
MSRYVLYFVHNKCVNKNKGGRGEMGSNITNLIDSVKNIYGWNDKQLAESLGVSSHSILSWKSGRRSPKRAIEIELEKLGNGGKGEKMLDNQLQDKDYIIKLQKEKIALLEKKLERVASQNTEIDLLLEWMLTNAYQAKAKKMIKH